MSPWLHKAVRERLTLHCNGRKEAPCCRATICCCIAVGAPSQTACRRPRSDATWQPGQATWDGSGLNFDASPAEIKQAITALKARCPQTRVLVSVGGYSFGDTWGGLNASAVAAFVQDFGGAIDGLDVDYEPQCPGCRSSPNGTVREGNELACAWPAACTLRRAPTAFPLILAMQVACATDATYIGIVQQLRAAAPRPLLLAAAVSGSVRGPEPHWGPATCLCVASWLSPRCS